MILISNRGTERIPNIRQSMTRLSSGFSLLKMRMVPPVNIRNTPAYRVKQVMAQIPAEIQSHRVVLRFRYLVILYIKSSIRMRKTVSDQSMEYTSWRAGLHRIQKSKIRLYHPVVFKNPFMIPPDTYNNTPNNIPFSQGPNCNGSSRVIKEIIVKKNG